MLSRLLTQEESVSFWRHTIQYHKGIKELIQYYGPSNWLCLNRPVILLLRWLFFFLRGFWDGCWPVIVGKLPFHFTGLFAIVGPKLCITHFYPFLLLLVIEEYLKKKILLGKCSTSHWFVRLSSPTEHRVLDLLVISILCQSLITNFFLRCWLYGRVGRPSWMYSSVHSIVIVTFFICFS